MLILPHRLRFADAGDDGKIFVVDDGICGIMSCAFVGWDPRRIVVFVRARRGLMSAVTLKIVFNIICGLRILIFEK